MGRVLDKLTFGPARRSRRMLRKLRALDRADAKLRAAGKDPLEEWRRSREARHPSQHPPAAAAGGGGRRARRRAAVLAVAVAAVASAVLLHVHVPGPAAAARPANFPPAGAGEQPDPLGHPQLPPAGAGGYRFEHTQPGDSSQPVTWDPCRPIHYVTSGGAPAALAGVVTAATSEITRITGLQFIDDGPTGEQPVLRRPATPQPRYGNRWAPVLIAWTSAQQIPDLAGNVLGLGGADAVTWAGHSTYVSGIVYLDTPDLTQLIDAAARRGDTGAGLQRARAVVLHEFGHLLGLAHVSGADQLMYPQQQPGVTDYGAGDLRGLYAEATGRCAPQL